MKKIILILTLAVLISACSLENIKDTALSPLEAFKNRGSEVGTSFSNRGIEILFLKDKPEDEIVGNFFIEAGFLNYMPYQTDVDLKLTTDIEESSSITSFRTLQGSLSVESALVDNEKIVALGDKIENIDFNAIVSDKTFFGGPFRFNFNDERNVQFLLEYSYNVDAQLNANIKLCNPENIEKDSDCDYQSISENNLGLAASTLPITVSSIKKTTYVSPESNILIVKLSFDVINKGTSGLDKTKNDNAEVDLIINPTTKAFSSMSCIASSKTRSFKGNGNSIKLKLEEGKSQVDCTAKANFAEQSFNSLLDINIKYKYTTRLTKTVKVSPLKFSNLES